MKKVAIIVLVTILAAGIILVGVGLIISKGNIDGLFIKDVRNEKRIDESQTITTLNLDISSDKIELYSSDDELLHIDYWDSELRPYNYSCNNGVAELKQTDNVKSWFNWHIRDTKTVKVYVPNTVTDTFSVKLAAGSLEDMGFKLKAANLRINISSGDANIKEAEATFVNIQMASGDIKLNNLAAQEINAKIASGHIELNNCKISEILDISISSGDVHLKNCSAKTLTTEISSGKIKADRLIVDTVRSKSSSGNIELYILGNPSEYSVEMNISSGKAIIEGEGVSFTTKSDASWGVGSKRIYCKSSSGDIKIYFVK